MVTSFISRWSKRKLDEKAHEVLNTDTLPVTEEPTPVLVDEQTHPVTDAADVEQSEPSLQEPDAQATSTLEQPEEMSIANLLTSDVEQSIKKAALRKLFLSEEFNVRDGLDDYDEDYSNLKTLSQSVAETLREWVKDKPEESESNAVAATSKEPHDEVVQEQQDDSQLNQVEETEAVVNQTDDGDQLAAGDFASDEENNEGETKYTTQ